MSTNNKPYEKALSCGTSKLNLCRNLNKNILALAFVYESKIKELLQCLTKKH
jgi:hypothetical protein